MFIAIAKLADLLLVVCAAFFTHLAQFTGGAPHSTFDLLFGLLGVVLTLLMFRVFNVYRRGSTGSAARTVTRTLAAWLVTQLLMGVMSPVWPDAAARHDWIVS